MKTNKLILTLTVTLAAIAFQACQKSDTNNLQEAQLCLNTATASTARDCVSSISSNTTAYADSLRCSAIFISEGFSTPAQFINAIDSMNDSGCSGTCSSTINALTTFNFSLGVDNAANTATANEAFTVCSKSGVKFYAQISSLFKLGTLAKIASGLDSPGATDIEAAINTLPDETLGEIVTTTYASVCTDTSEASAETQQYCAELSTALEGNSSSAEIGSCLKLILATPGATCP